MVDIAITKLVAEYRSQIAAHVRALEGLGHEDIADRSPVVKRTRKIIRQVESRLYKAGAFKVAAALDDLLRAEVGISRCVAWGLSPAEHRHARVRSERRLLRALS